MSGWARLPASVRARVLRSDPKRPWMVPAAVERLNVLMNPSWRVLEFGSGASTAWYAARSAHVVSLEDDTAWYEHVQSLLTPDLAARCDLRCIPLKDFRLVAADLDPASFDLVVVDGNHEPGATRADCAAAARPLVKPGGYVVVDDSDSNEFAPMLNLFPGWSREKYIGVKHRPLMAVETSILRRPTADSALA